MTSETDWLADRFAAHRPRLHAIALRILGSTHEADDALQEAWLRAQRADRDEVENPPAWLTTIVARVSISMLRSKKSRREELVDDVAEPIPLGRNVRRTPEEEAVLADSVSMALLVVLDTLGPDERLAFVLHDLFDLPFDEIASVLGRSADSTRQLASRARRKVRGQSDEDEPRVVRRRGVVEQYLQAIREGDVETLVTLLHPDVVLTADGAALPHGKPARLVGVAQVRGGALASGSRAAQSDVALVNGRPGVVMAPNRRLAMALTFEFDEDDKITLIDVIADPDRVAATTIALGPV